MKAEIKYLHPVNMGKEGTAIGENIDNVDAYGVGDGMVSVKSGEELIMVPMSLIARVTITGLGEANE